MNLTNVDGMSLPARGARRGVARDLLVLSVVWIAMIVIVRPFGDFPINDDWVYALTVRTLVETGSFQLYDFSSAHLGPLAYWGALFAKVFGFSYDSLRLSTLVLGLAGGIVLYLLFREAWADRVAALVFALAIIVNPIYFALANTFMTDVPFVLLWTASMLALFIGLKRDDNRWLAFGIALTLFSVFVRQFAVLVLVGFAVAYPALRGVRPKTIAVALLPLVAGLAIHFLFSRWRNASPPIMPNMGDDIAPGILWLLRTSAFRVVSYLGLLLAPLVVLYLPVSSGTGSARRVGIVWAAIVVLALSMAVVHVGYGISVPVGTNILNSYGIGPLTDRDTLVLKINLPQVPPAAALGWKLVTVVTVVASGGVLVAVALGIARLRRRWRERTTSDGSRAVAAGLFFATVASSYIGVLLLIAHGFSLFDRYLVPLAIIAGLAVPFVANPGARAPVGRLRATIAMLMIAASAAFSVVATHDFLAWGKVRWSVLQALVANGVSPTRIDGGYEFNGTYTYQRPFKRRPGKSWYWVQDDEFVTASGIVDGYTRVHRYPVDRWWDNGASDVYLLQR